MVVDDSLTVRKITGRLLDARRLSGHHRQGRRRGARASARGDAGRHAGRHRNAAHGRLRI